MNFRVISNVLILIVILSFSGCGAFNSDDTFILNGSITIDSADPSIDPASPLVAVLSKTMDFKLIEDDPLNNIIDIIKVDSPHTFSADLSQYDLKPGDGIYVFTFIDNGYTSGIPTLSEGDLIGYYIDYDNLDLRYTLKEGSGNNIEITMNKIYMENTSTVEGTVQGSESCDVLLVAYTGEMNSSDAQIDNEKVIGFSKITKGSAAVSYKMEIFPIIAFPVKNVYIFAIMDNNKNGIPDNGDRLGYYSGTNSNIPALVTLQNGVNSGMDIGFHTDYIKPVSDENIQPMTLSGNIKPPTGYSSDISTKPIYVIISGGGDAADFINNPTGSMKYFMKLPQGKSFFMINLSGTGLVPGDKIMVTALWDRDYVSGFPGLTAGDMIGTYMDNVNYTFEYTLKDADNSVPMITLNKTYASNNAYLKGSILGSETGDVILIAYTGVFNTLDAPIETNKIVGYKKLTKGSSPLAYSLDILPFVLNFPMSSVYVMAILDKNKNGVPDNGDRVGFYSNNIDKIPTQLAVYNTSNNNVNIEFTIDYSKPVTGGAAISIDGTITTPSGYTNFLSTKPVYIIVAKTDDGTDFMNNPMAAMKYFIKLPQGTKSYHIDLSGTGLVPGDTIMVTALWDRDYISGFPNLTNNDMIGYYINAEDFNYQYTLKSGANAISNINVNKTYKSNYAKIQGSILGSNTGSVILVAYTGEFNSLDAKLDADKIIAYKNVTKSTSPLSYSMDLLPFVTTFPVADVYVFAILDRNNNGIPDNGDRLGFYTNNANKVPSLTTLGNSTNTGINIEFMLDYVQTVAGNTPMTLSGSITPPAGYTTNKDTKPIFIIVASADNTFSLFSDPMAAIKYFVKLPQGATSYNIDLAGAGLNPGDEIRILALWDRNYTGGFPSPDNGDKIGYYQQKANFNFSKIIAAGANDAYLINGWSFGVDKTIYNNNAQFRFQIKQNAGSGSNSDDLSTSQILGKDLIVVMVHEGGVNTSDYSITDMDYVISMDYVKNVTSLPAWYTLYMFPFISDNIPKSGTLGSISDPLRVSNVYIYVILDSNGNSIPDPGENVGYYWTYYFVVNKVPAKYSSPIYFDRVNTLSGEVVSIFTRTY